MEMTWSGKGAWGWASSVSPASDCLSDRHIILFYVLPSIVQIGTKIWLFLLLLLGLEGKAWVCIPLWNTGQAVGIWWLLVVRRRKKIKQNKNPEALLLLPAGDGVLVLKLLFLYAANCHTRISLIHRLTGLKLSFRPTLAWLSVTNWLEFWSLQTAESELWDFGCDLLSPSNLFCCDVW